jgi:hypothetical protein
VFETKHCYQDGLFKIKKIHINSSVISVNLLMALLILESDFRLELHSVSTIEVLLKLRLCVHFRPRVLFAILP